MKDRLKYKCQLVLGKKLHWAGEILPFCFFHASFISFLIYVVVVLKTNKKKHDSSPIFFEPNINDNMGKQILGYTYMYLLVPLV